MPQLRATSDLYDRFREKTREFPNELALVELQSGRRWTFAELATASEFTASKDARAVFPRGNSAEFILAIVRAWRNGQGVCPLETDQSEPSFENCPREWVHFKTTSASTGPARLVAFTAKQIAADAAQIVSTMGLKQDWPNVALISLAHSYGFSNLVTPLLLHGIPLMLAGSGLPEALRRATSVCSAITVPAVPALWRAWLEAGVLCPQIRLGISAGAPLPLALEKDVFERHALKIHNFYGASECGGIAYDRSELPRTDSTCIGEPLHDVNVSLNENGCLEVRGEAVGQTYWPEPSVSLADGCFTTSDLAVLEHGQVFLRGRQADVMNLAGRKLPPETIEVALLTHPAVRECVVFAVPSSDSSRGDVAVACVVAEPAISGEMLRDFLLEKLPAWQIPREWWFVDTLGASSRGKISRAKWRELYLNR